MKKYQIYLEKSRYVKTHPSSNRLTEASVFQKKILNEWNTSTRNILKVLPNISEQSILVGNHLEMIEDAIRLGFVVQKFGQRHRIYFNNRKSYDLSNLPPHVFFDGTLIHKKFLKKKLQNVRLERMKIPVKPLWSLRVWQNKNTDLSKTAIDRDREKVKGLLNILLNVLGSSHKYLFLSSKATRQNYLSNFLKQTFPHLEIISGHYGYLRGINEAEDCNVGFMLGSYMPSDAVEIAMALEFIQRVLPQKATTPTYVNFWSWKGSKSRRVYKRKLGVINKIAETLRHSEHRQAMARARYLFHDVDFYVFSKDPVKKYEPYAQIMDDEFMDDIFPPRPERSDSKYEEVKEKILNLLAQQRKLGEMDFHRLTGHSRTTLRNHLKRMLDDDRVPIVRDGQMRAPSQYCAWSNLAYKEMAGDRKPHNLRRLGNQQRQSASRVCAQCLGYLQARRMSPIDQLSLPRT